MDEYGLDVVFLCFLDERPGVVMIQGPVSPPPRVAREELYSLALQVQRLRDDFSEAAAYRDMEAESHFKR